MTIPTITLVQLESEQPTSYMRGGATRQAGGGVPPLSAVMTVGQTSNPAGWRLARSAAEDWKRLQEEIVRQGGELVRLTEAARDQGDQARAREGYLLWVAAGRPSPNGRGWVSGMKAAYVAAPGESNHGWGGAVDIDVGALQMPSCARGSNASLAAFWDVAIAHGFEPIIARPSVHQSEAWHFDHLGGLAAVRDLYDDDPAYRGREYAQTARVGCALALTLPDSVVRDVTIAYVQARCAIAGAFPGAIDGAMGPKTRAALAAVGVTAGRKSGPTLVSELDGLGVGLEQIAAL